MAQPPSSGDPVVVPDPLARVELRHLRAFLVIADSSSLTEAAGTLGISQPSLSALLATLEGHLGPRLVVRDRRGVRLTAEGRRAREALLGPVTALNTALRALAADDTPVVVGLPEGAGPAVRAVAEPAVAGRFPGRPIHWEFVDSPERPTPLEADGFDATVEWSPVNNTARRLAELPLGVLVPVDSPAARTGKIRPADLSGRRLVAESADLFYEVELVAAMVRFTGGSAYSPEEVSDPTAVVAPDTFVLTVDPGPDSPFPWVPLDPPESVAPWIVLR